MLNFSYANAFNLITPKILSFGKRLKIAKRFGRCQHALVDTFRKYIQSTFLRAWPIIYFVSNVSKLFQETFFH